MDTKYLYKLLLLVFILSGTINNTFAQAPTISSFTPTSGPVGTLVTITGTNLTAPTAFSIGGAPDIIVSNTASSLVGMVMQGAITGIISITTAGGTATSISNFTVTATTYPSVQQGQKLLGTGVVPNVYQGCSVSLSADGNTAIVGGDIDAGADGAVWVYIRSGGVWTQQGPKLVGTGAIGAALQGISVSLSADGNTAIIGGYYDNSYAGAAWIFIRSGSVWAQQGPKLVGTGASISAEQGISVSISGDGNTAIIGGANDDNSVGAAWVFTRSAGVWTQQGSKLLGTGVVGAARQGSSVSLSSDGNTAIVGGTNDNGFAGATWVFTRSGVVWTQQGLKLVGLGAVGVARQGNSISLSADGNTIIVGGNGDNNYAGAAWVFTRSGVVWIQQGSKLVGTGLVGAAFQGSSVSLSADGNTAIVGGYSDNVGVGAAWIYTRSVGVWTQQGPKLIGTGTTGPAYQGTSASMSADGNTMMVGGPNNSTGAVWVYTRSGGVWTQQGSKLTGTGSVGIAFQGTTVSLSADGNTAIEGGLYDNNNTGAAWIFTRSGLVWTQQGSKLVGTGAVGEARQGLAVSLSADGNTAVVGGPTDHGNQGAIWVYKSAFSAASDYFRSITSGNWNNPTTWESSAVADFSSGIINPATLTPDITANDINIRSSHTVTVTANVTTDQTFINPGGTLTITGSTLIVSNSGLTIQSTVAGTGRVGNSTGTISGNVNIERYIANAGHRAWHLLSAKAVTGAQTIYEAWQEAGVSGVSLPGYGTWVTSNLFTGSNGFDATSVSSSILTHIQGGAGGPSWNYGLTNTNTALSANPGYMLFVRGDRNYKPTLPTPIATSATTLRSKGVLTQGTQPAVTVSATGTGRTLVGNPYASPIDFESIQATLNLNQTFYVWDATLTGNYGVGGFVLVDRNGGVYQTTPVVLGGTNANPNSRYIHMGQAFFLKATGADASVVFTENSKASTVPIINPIVNGPGEQQLIANLMIVNPSNIESLADGIRIKYADNYSPKTNDDDEKMGNFNENISSFRDDKKWIVERRPMINGNDTIFLRITNTSIKDYRLQLGTFDFVQTDILAWLQDTYLGTNTSIDLTGSITNVDFSVTADPASANQSRFRIIFGSNTTTIPPGITGISVYPNPVVNHTIGIVFNNMDKGVYGLRLINSMGQVIFTQQLNYSGGTAKYSVHPSANIAKGIYWLECIKPNHSKLLKKLVVAEK